MALSEKQLQILDAAEELFADKGFEGTSVRDIAQRAKINVAMISYYFGSKEKLLESLITHRTAQTSMVLEGLIHDHDLDPWEKVTRIVDYYVDKMIDQHRLHTILNRQISMIQDEAITELLIGIKRRNTAMISEIIEEGQRKGIFRKVDVSLTIGTVMGTISQVSMSRPFYGSLMKIAPGDTLTYFRKIRRRLKAHLKSLLKAHLDIKNDLP